MRKVASLVPGLILITIVLLFSTATYARPPEVKKALETRLYQGSNAEISAFIEQRRILIENIIAEISEKEDKPSLQDSHYGITSIIDLYQGISIQYESLLTELPRNPPEIIKRPQVEGPPFSLDGFDEVLAYQEHINIILTENSRHYTLTQSRLIHMKEQAIDSLSEYSRVLNTNLEDQLSLYEKHAKLLSLQYEYALLYLRKPKIETQLKKLNDENKSVENWIKEAFTQLVITPDDLKKAEQIYQQELATLKETTNETSAEYQDLNHRLLIYENRFDNVADKSRGEKNNAPEQKQQKWLIERERIELIRSALTLRIHLIEQRRLSEKIELHGSDFRLQWLNCYINQPQEDCLADFIKTWSQQGKDLDHKLETLIRTTSEATLARSSLVRKLVTINNLKTSTPPGKQHQALLALIRQAEKTNENIDKVIIELSRNSLDIQNLKFGIERILLLSKISTSKSEQIRIWSFLRFTKIKESIQNLLYYPLFSIGTSTITLQVIFKIIFLFILSIFCLRLLRRKVSTILEKKAGMSTGSINSITTLAYYLGLIFCTIIVLSTAGLDLSQLGIVLGALGVGIGFGLQTIVNNFLSGIILLSEQTVKVGDCVNLKEGVIGKVKKMSIRTTIIRDFEGVDTIVPNSDLIANRVETWTYGDDWRRLKIPFGVAYDSDPDEVEKLAKAAAREINITQEDFLHPLRVFFEGFGDNSLDFSIRPWCRISFLQTGSGITSDYYFALFRKLKEAGISIPFPQRDLHLTSLSTEIIEKLRELKEEKPEEKPLESKD